MKFLTTILIILSTSSIIWYVKYLKGLEPKLEYTLQVSDIDEYISFDTRGIAHGYAIKDVINKLELEYKNNKKYFITKGKKVTKFIPEKFNWVKGECNIIDGDINTIYVYSYNSRYRPIIEEP